MFGAAAGLLLWLFGLGSPLANERLEENSGGSYFSFNSYAVSSFSVHTTSSTLSPARIKTRPGYQVGVGIGYRIHDTRIEGSFIYGRFDADSIRFAEGGGPLSGYFDLRGLTLELTHEFSPQANLRPYMGLGIGLLNFRANDVKLRFFPPTEGVNTLFSHQFMAGVAYSADPWRFSIGYRYLGMGEQDFSTGPDSLRADPLRTDAFQAGVQLAF